MNSNPRRVHRSLNDAERKDICLAWVLILRVCTTSARAEVSAILTAKNDYDFRGESQTAYAPAAQFCLEVTGDGGRKSWAVREQCQFWPPPRLG